VSDILLTVDSLSKQFGGFAALSDLSLTVGQGERLGIIGPNGSGKTTLINCISGLLRNDAGTISFDGTNITGLAPHERTRLGIARSFQIPRPFASMTLAENLAVPLEFVRHHRSLHTADVRGEALAILEQMGLRDKADLSSTALTQIDLRKLELARALAARPRLLILDEAMAGLSSVEVDEVLAILFDLNSRGITIIMVEHIMRAIMRFSQRVLCLDAGCLVAEGTPEHIVSDPNVGRVYLGA
jgi:branched-chain amino acid transport system ATP-binding protein